jgi:hypothetical protein
MAIAQQATAKRVYFAFHYQDVIDFRANVVRKHNALQGVEGAGYYDHSIWEESKRTGDVALKRLINSELEGTSVTVVLIGSYTYGRRWVRYEIAKSIERGNKLVGIHINGIARKDGLTKSSGPNPFLNMGLAISEDGQTGQLSEWNGERWVWYGDLGRFALNQQPAEMRGRTHYLTHWFRTYDWITDDGYQHFCNWIA